jgi:hypothetical protein
VLFHGATRPVANGSADPQRRARIALIWGVFLFATLQLGFFPISRVWPQIQDGEYGHKLANLRSQIRSKPKDKPTIVMLGSSLTGWALNPESMGELKPGNPGAPVVYNFGINSSGVVVELICLKRLLAEGIRPDLVLIETHPWFLFEHYNRVTDKEHCLPPIRLQPRDLLVAFRYDMQGGQLLRDWADHHWAPWYYHRHELQNYLLLEWVNRGRRIDVWNYTDQYGWEGGGFSRVSQGLRTQEEKEKATMPQLQMMANSPIFLDSHRALREIVATCRKAQLPFALVRMPEMRIMREEAPPAFREKIDRFYEELLCETGATVIDARDWVADEGFRDGFHLHPEGSEVFSGRLEREVLSPFVAAYGKPGEPRAGSLTCR